MLYVIDDCCVATATDNVDFRLTQTLGFPAGFSYLNCR